MPVNGALPDAVRRVLARDDLMMLAREAEAAVDIVREGMTDEHVFRHESELFSEALRMYWYTARNAAVESDCSSVAQLARDNAGVIVRLCRLLKLHPGAIHDVDVGTFHTQAVAELAATRETLAGDPVDRDLYQGRIILYHAGRDLRIGGDYAAAIDLVERGDKEFVGTGADILRAAFHFELSASYLLCGRVAEVRTMLREAIEEGYWKAVAASEYVSRHRIEYTLALAAWAEGDLDEAASQLARAHRYLHRTGRRAARYDVEDLLLSLARAELLVDGHGPTLPTVNRVIDHLDEALRTIEGIRDRWRVISRSGSPLAAAIRRVYGDIARAAAALNGRQAAELGLRVALSAKQSGFAGRMRADRFDVENRWWKGRRLRSLLDQVVEAESGPQLGGAAAENEKRLDDLRQRIEQAVSPLLADVVVPVPANIARVIDAVGHRYALDYVSLPDTVTGEATWFRTLVEPSGGLSFDHLASGAALSAFLTAVEPATVALTDVLSAGVDWPALGEQLLPRSLRDGLAVAEAPVTLVISAHSALSLMPWGALGIDTNTRLVERAVITQTPVLTCLSGPSTAPASGPALIHLVPKAEGGIDLNVESERAAWGIRLRDDGHVPLVECALELGRRPTDLPRTLADTLSRRGHWRYAHVASHGEGEGLGQTLLLPGAPISAGRALTLHWPQSLLIVSCKVGRLVNIEHAEPLNFVMAALAGGAEQVVACIDEVPDYSAGRAAAEIVRRSRTNGTRLDVALHDAQLHWVKGRWPDIAWTLFAAYTR
ncbi:CHAT domain-containing protein [Micromonospora sp. NPDC049240]|uniref:CHAT domain-containing protein n=1 Tax=Micromonospora sp. NPDC049240 TaxID=3155151 RepID=UPI0034029BCE